MFLISFSFFIKKSVYATRKTLVTYAQNHLELLLRPTEKVVERKRVARVSFAFCVTRMRTILDFADLSTIKIMIFEMMDGVYLLGNVFPWRRLRYRGRYIFFHNEKLSHLFHGEKIVMKYWKYWVFHNEDHVLNTFPRRKL